MLDVPASLKQKMLFGTFSMCWVTWIIYSTFVKSVKPKKCKIVALLGVLVLSLFQYFLIYVR